MAISAIKQKAASSNRNQMKDGSGIVHGSLVTELVHPKGLASALQCDGAAKQSLRGDFT